MKINNLQRLIPYLFFFISALLIVWFVDIAEKRDLTQLEIIFFQILILSTSLIGSYQIGRQTAKDIAREMIKPHAKSAFRRGMSLYRTLSRVAGVIAATDPKNDALKLTLIEGIVVEQINTADDALADWQEVIPESTDELRRKMHDWKEGRETDG